MKKIHVFPVLVFACSVLVVTSCNQSNNDPGLETNPGLSVDAVIEKHNLKRLSEGQTSEMLKAGNFLNFETATEADAFLTEMAAAGKKGIHVKGKVDSKQTRSGAENQQIITVPLFSAGGLDDFSKLAATSNSDDGAGSTGLTRDWGAGADLRVVVSWNSGYTGINTTANIESVANYNTWETEQSSSSYNPSTGEIDFTVYGQVHINLFLDGVGTFQSKNGEITGSYNPTTKESVVNWTY